MKDLAGDSLVSLWNSLDDAQREHVLDTWSDEDLAELSAELEAEAAAVQAQTDPLAHLSTAEWLQFMFPKIFAKEMAEHHKDLCAWADTISIERDAEDPAYIGVWPRGHSKSGLVEAIVAMMLCRGRRRYFLYCGDIQARAEDHLQNIASLLETDQVEHYYPNVGKRLLGKWGNVRGWRRMRIRCGNGATVDAIGLDTAARGVKLENMRPDGICHEVGTRIFDEGRWMNVEDHPGLLGFRAEKGRRVRVWGNPFAEVVTDEHRYWCRKLKGGRPVGEDGWMTAVEIEKWAAARNKTVAIGTPIDRSVRPLQPIVLGQTRMRRYDPTTKTNSVEYVPHMGVPDELNDPEWWWLMGFWWGDGHTTRGGGNKHAVCLTLATHQPEIRERALAVLAKWGYGWSETMRVRGTCSMVTFSCKWMYEWTLSDWYLPDNVGRKRCGQKAPPQWVEWIDPTLQAHMMRGYYDADGHNVKSEMRCVSVSVQGLLAGKRILARLGVPASMRLGPNSGHPGQALIMGRWCNVQPKYDLRIRHGAEALGFEPDPITRNSRPNRVWIDGDMLWSGVRSVEETAEEHKFAPITTSGHTYVTDFGLSHNCLDDIDQHADSLAETAKKIDVITLSLLPAGANNLAVFGVQNLINRRGVFARLVDRTAGFLEGARLSGPIPAIVDPVYGSDEKGRPCIVSGAPTWPSVKGIPQLNAEIIRFGLRAFRLEMQHEEVEAEGALWDQSLIDTHRVRSVMKAAPSALQDKAEGALSDADAEGALCSVLAEGALCRDGDPSAAPSAGNPTALPELTHVVIGVDPATTSKRTSDETGIIVAGKGIDGRCYILADLSGRYSPRRWARVVLAANQIWRADWVVCEVNNGGDLFEEVIMANLEAGDERPNFSVVTASKGKFVRAEPIVGLYQAHSVYHCGVHVGLEREMTTWRPPNGLDPGSSWSPNRLDALVWAVWKLMVEYGTEQSYSSASVLESLSGRPGAEMDYVWLN